MRSRLRPRGRGRLIVGLFLACVVFWNGADFFHADEGSDYVPDCPVCNLQRITSCETPAATVAQACSLLVLVSTLAVPQVVEGDSVDHSLPARPRGPPSIA